MSAKFSVTLCVICASVANTYRGFGPNFNIKETPMKISKSAAREIGTKLAESLHDCKLPSERGAVLNAKYDIMELLEDDTRLAYRVAFDLRLDELEPLDAPRSWAIHGTRRVRVAC